MAVKRLAIGDIRYTCLAEDTKPSDAISGDRLFETDTKKLYIYDGADWNLLRTFT